MKKPINRTGVADLWLASMIVLPVILIWEFLVRVFQIPVYLLLSPSQILVNLAENYELYFEASLLTLGEALAGLILGLLAGILGATLLGLRPRMERGYNGKLNETANFKLLARHNACRNHNRRRLQ